MCGVKQVSRGQEQNLRKHLGRGLWCRQVECVNCEKDLRKGLYVRRGPPVVDRERVPFKTKIAETAQFQQCYPMIGIYSISCRVGAELVPRDPALWTHDRCRFQELAPPLFPLGTIRIERGKLSGNQKNGDDRQSRPRGCSSGCWSTGYVRSPTW